MLKKKTNYEVTTKAKCLEDTATGQEGAVAFQTFKGDDVEISNEYHIPYHAICSVKVKISTDEVEVDDPTCQGNEPPVPPEPPVPKPNIFGANDTSISQYSSFDVLDGVSATDYKGDALTVTVSGTVNTEVAGTYSLTYSATDDKGQTTTVTRRVTVTEVESPTITGVSDVSISEGSSFDPMAGVSATDYAGNNVEVIYTGTVDVNVPGVYTLTYTATDTHGKTTTATRTVTVIQTDAPIINGADDVTINQGVGIDLEDGVSATLEGNPISFTVSPTTLDACDVGSHTVTYTATGNNKTTTVERVITIEQIANPNIVGLTTLNITRTEQFDPTLGVSAIDGNGNTITVTSDATNPMSYDTVGTKTITYTAVDSCGNETVATRTVNVTSQARIEGATNTTSPQGVAFDLDDGVTAYDDFGDETNYTVSPSAFDECTVGNQAYTYTSAVGTVVERVITVTAIANPTISGLTALEVEVDEQFDPMQGVSAVDGNGNTLAVTCDASNPMSYDTAGVNTITYTAIDSCGNETNEQRTVNVLPNMATVLFADGTFIINELGANRAADIQSYGAVVKEYEPLDANNPYVLSRGDDQMWFAERSQIKSVSFGSAVQPTSMGYWFQNCQNLESIDWTNFDGSVNTSLRALFASTKLTSFSGIPEMPNVETLRFMFNACESLVTCSMRGLNSAKVTDTNGMFQGCYALEEVTLAFGDSNIQICGNMFSNYNNDGKGDMKIRTIYNTATQVDEYSLRDYPYFRDATTTGNMFRSCTSLVGGDGTPFSPLRIDNSYARCDYVAGNEWGYFTKID